MEFVKSSIFQTLISLESSYVTTIYLPAYLKAIQAITVPVWAFKKTYFTLSSPVSIKPIPPLIIPHTKISFAAFANETTSPPKLNDSIIWKLYLDQRLTL